jgi:hypothetical protein
VHTRPGVELIGDLIDQRGRTGHDRVVTRYRGR